MLSDLLLGDMLPDTIAMSGIRSPLPKGLNRPLDQYHQQDGDDQDGCRNASNYDGGQSSGWP